MKSGTASDSPRVRISRVSPTLMERTGARDVWPHWTLVDSSLVGAVLSVIMVVRIGHAGAKAAWTPVVNASNQR